MSLLFTMSLMFGAIFLVCLIEPFAAQTVDYCSPELCNGRKHIACNNTGAFAAACAANAKVIDITTDLRAAILNKHNEYRNQIALGKLDGFLPAIRMATMTWDTEMAMLAALNVKQCDMMHDACHSTAAYKISGQNLAYSGWSGMTRNDTVVVMEHIQMWFDEYKLTNMTVINKFQDLGNINDYGHFTSMVHEKNCRAGCAILRQTKGGFTYQYMACNYAITNIFDRPIYRRGPTASKCTTGTNKNFPGLCSPKEKYDVSTGLF